MLKLLKGIDIKKAASWAGVALMVLSLLFITRRFYLMRHELDFSALANFRVFAALLLVAWGEGLGIILGSVNFRYLLANVSGFRAKLSLVTRAYTASNIYKYIPGGLMYVLGRNQIAIETEELSHGKIFLATALEGVFIAVAAFILSVLYISDYAIYYFRQVTIPPLLFLLLGLVVAVAVPLLYYFRRRLLRLLENIKKDSKDFRLAALTARMAFALGQMNLSALLFLATLLILGQPMTLSLGIAVMGLYILSWLAGFLTPGAPSGLGIREAVLLLFLSGMLDEGILLSAMVMQRVLIVVGDVFAYGVGHKGMALLRGLRLFKGRATKEES